MKFAVGSLVNARGRNWVVLPESAEDFLIVRPLGGANEEVAGIDLELEEVRHGGLPPITLDHMGDHVSSQLLRDAVRLSFRNSAGPFRSFARLGFEPRPYQLVPLLMALKQETIRLLIADDVGIGKTVEAGLIARELLERGEIQKMAVLCPPHLAEQWQAELKDKFNINAELVLSGTAKRLERNRRLDETIFDIYPITIVSLDFIKTPRRRDEFLRTCPEFIIVDEAHTCAWDGESRSGIQQRYQLIRDISQKEDQHLVLVTATPHSGKDEAFRSLLSLINSDFSTLPDDLSGTHNEPVRRELARYFVQRRRKDIKNYLGSDTFFPKRQEKEIPYQLDIEYKSIFDSVIDFVLNTIELDGTSKLKQRVQWWSALSLLRSLASSPAAAIATLTNRAAGEEADRLDEIDEIGRRLTLDPLDDDQQEGIDVIHGSDFSRDDSEGKKLQSKLREFARSIENIPPEKDAKLQLLLKEVKELINNKNQSFAPIIFCRYIPTAEYVADYLRSHLKGVEVLAVTGLIPPEERENRVLKLGEADKRVLVATDCLSEGINLQQYFNAVFHYDLAWNPTRHEQREGRVDRFGQSSPTVRVGTFYSTDNQIDGIVLNVLLRKHREIRKKLGISIPVPVDSSEVMEAIFEGLVLKSRRKAPEQLELFEELVEKKTESVNRAWEAAEEKEQKSRTLFSQSGINIDDQSIRNELAATKRAIGSGADVQQFMELATLAYNGYVNKNGVYSFNYTDVSRPLRETLGLYDQNKAVIKAAFELPVQKGVEYLHRTHPVVENLSTWVLDSALEGDGPAARCGIIRTKGVERRTILALVRYRFHILHATNALLAEDLDVIAFNGSLPSINILPDEEAQKLMNLHPDDNISSDLARDWLSDYIKPESQEQLAQTFLQRQEERGKELLEAHRRVRDVAKAKGRYDIKGHQPDLMGLFIYLPA